MRACKAVHLASKSLFYITADSLLIVAPHFDKWPHLTRFFFFYMKEPAADTDESDSQFQLFFFLSKKKIQNKTKKLVYLCVRRV